MSTENLNFPDSVRYFVLYTSLLLRFVRRSVKFNQMERLEYKSHFISEDMFDTLQEKWRQQKVSEKERRFVWSFPAQADIQDVV